MSDARQPLRLYHIGRQLWTSWGTLTGRAAFPVWTPDGQHVVFNWINQERSAIHIGPRDGSAALRQLTSGPRPRVPSDVSPDGLLAFVENFTPTGMDWVMPLDGSAAPRRVVHTPGDDAQPAFSADGRWLAYSSDVSGTMEIYVEAFPGPGPRLQVSSGGGRAAIWARDARTLYYVQTIGDATLMEVPIETKPTLSAGRPRPLLRFPYLVSGRSRSHDIAPDEQRFIVATYEQPGGTPVTQLQVVVNWPERLNH